MTESDQLDRLLAMWAARNRLTSAQVSAVRAQVLSTVAASEPSPAGLDADWLWSLLRPVTALVERLDAIESPAARAAWPRGFGQDWTSYLQLA